MSVVSVKQTSAREAERLEDNVRRYVANYIVITDDSATDTEYTVLTDARVPQRGAQYANDLNAKAWRARVVSRDKTKNAWDVEVEYYTLAVNSSPTELDQYDSPLAVPAVHEYRVMHTTRTFSVDRNGNPIVNAANEPYDAADTTIPYAHAAWIVTYNRPSFNAYEAERFTLAVNSVEFEGWPARTVLCWDISASQQYSEALRVTNPDGSITSGKYYQITIELHLNRETWDLQLLNVGHRAYGVSPFGVLVPFYLDEDGPNPVPDPVPRFLTVGGYELPPGGQPNFRVFEVYKQEDLRLMEFLI